MFLFHLRNGAAALTKCFHAPRRQEGFPQLNSDENHDTRLIKMSALLFPEFPVPFTASLFSKKRMAIHLISIIYSSSFFLYEKCKLCDVMAATLFGGYTIWFLTESRHSKRSGMT